MKKIYRTESRLRWPAALAAGALALGAGTAASTAHAATGPAPASSPSTPAAAAKTEEAGSAPYMGWSSYSMQVYSGDGKWITADQIIAQSDAMHGTLQDYGYEYINIDAGWNDGVDGNGRPVPSETLFPDGLQAVIDHIHANGQKVGLYFIPGISPEVAEADLPIAGAPECSTGDIVKQPVQQADYWGIGHRIDFSNPCAQAYVDSIADLIGSWGVDFVKFDSVTPGSGVGDLTLDARDDVAAWSTALERNDIWFELSWALDIRYAEYWKQYADGWRIDWDVECYCEKEALTTWDNIARLFPKLADWWRHAGPDGWNDLDSLNVGNGQMDGLTKDERRTAATLWAVSAAPMYIGNDMTQLDEYGISLLTNREVIAVNQAGIPAHPVSTGTSRQTWYAVNPDGSVTVAVFNLGRTDADIAVSLEALGIDGSAKVRDLWKGKNLGGVTGEFVAEDIPVHGAALYTFSPERKTAITLNDDDARLGYDGEWNRNAGMEVPARTQDLTVSVYDSSAGGEAPEPGASNVVVLNDSDSGIVYSGNWGHSTGRGLGDYQDDVHYAEADGAAFEHVFVGTGIDWVTETHESQGEAEVYLDGVLVDTVDTFQAEGRGAQQVVYSVRDLPNGTHTLRVVKKTGQFMLLDRLDVVQEGVLDIDHVAFDRAAPADAVVTLLRDPGELVEVSLNGESLSAGDEYTLDGNTLTLGKDLLASLPDGDTDISFRFRGDLRDDVHWTSADGASVTLAFTGSSVSITGAVGPDQGTAEIYIDDELVDTVDLHSDTRLTQQELFRSDTLKKGEHTIRIVKASGEVLRIDSLSYVTR
ncbi:X2-like carbohydrate binding domain-containing protein [Microbacterium hydrocarbonoxydans]|uniref:X2-like carbohydrate binding domain-containing protein n=1 Tax=Microbacterium hydrocarbonoxydans TaxID=273678 RepID=UPI0013DBA972|nr:X2-like carbohydrate binding domain-containing protein [Microbacterium hydrocarbonoxydans]